MTDRNNPDRCCDADCCAGRGVGKEPPAVVRIAVGTAGDYEMVTYVPAAETKRLRAELVYERRENLRLRTENDRLKAQLAGVGVRRDVP